MEMALIVGISVAVVTLLALTIVVFMVGRLRRYERSQRKKHNAVQRLSSIHSVTDSGLGSGSSMSNIDFQELHLQNVLKCGRYGVVWKAKFRGEDVAVKIFQEAQRTAWSTEKDFLQDPSLAHDNIVQFIAADTKDISDSREHWLVMSYYECGNLSDYLKTSILSWNDMVSLSHCLVLAVAYLHSESNTNGVRKTSDAGVRKTSVAHRDIKSANILVQNGHSCVLADFGMAIRLREDISMKQLANSGQVSEACIYRSR
jgi:serine/threonine protein kinase